MHSQTRSPLSYLDRYGGLLNGRPTVREIIRRGVLGRCGVLAGRAGLSKPVRTITVLSAPEPENWVRGGELVLTNAYAFRNQPEDLSHIIRVFSTRQTSALGIQIGRFIDGVPSSVREEADRAAIPLIDLPNDLAWGDVFEQFATMMSRMREPPEAEMLLSQLTSPRSRPLHALGCLLQVLSTRLRLESVLLDATLRPLAAARPEGGAPRPRTKDSDADRNGSSVRRELKGSSGSLGYLIVKGSPELVEWALETPLGRGIVRLIEIQAELLQERIALRRARSHALGLLTKSQDHGAVASVLNLDPKKEIRVVALYVGSSLIHTSPGSGWDEHLIEEIEDALNATTAFCGDALLAFTTLSEEEVLTTLNSRILSDPRGDTLRAGISSGNRGSQVGLLVSEAVLALRLARTLCPPQTRIISYRDAPFRDLLTLGETPEHVASVLDVTVSGIRALEQASPDLVETLREYLNCDCSVGRASKVLHIHPSTLKYRIRKIQEFISLDSFDDKARAYLALTYHDGRAFMPQA